MKRSQYFRKCMYFAKIDPNWLCECSELITEHFTLSSSRLCKLALRKVGYNQPAKELKELAK